MHVVSLLALAVQEQVGVAPVGSDDGRLYLWIALLVGVLALVAALMLARRDRARFTMREQRKTSLLALVCFFFLVWTTWGVGAQVVFWGFLVLLLGTPLYIWFKTRVPSAA